MIDDRDSPYDLQAIDNALVRENVRNMFKAALTGSGRNISPGALLRKIHRPHKVQAGDKWKVVDDDGHVYGTFGDETGADQQVKALYAAKGRQ